MEDRLRIIGCGGHARSIADVAVSNDPTIQIVFYDKNAEIDEKIRCRTKISYTK